MILLVDNMIHLIQFVTQYIGKFDEVQVLQMMIRIYQVAQEADALVFSPGPGWPKDAGMEEMIRDSRGSNQSWGFAWGITIAKFLRRIGAIMHGKQS